MVASLKIGAGDFESASKAFLQKHIKLRGGLVLHQVSYSSLLSAEEKLESLRSPIGKCQCIVLKCLEKLTVAQMLLPS